MQCTRLRKAFDVTFVYITYLVGNGVFVFYERSYKTGKYTFVT